MLERRLVGDQLLDLMLGEIADAQLAARHERTAHRLELTGEKTRERGLAVAVAADQCDAVVRIDAHIEARQHRHVRRVAGCSIVEHDQRRPQFLGARKIENHGGVVRHRVDRLQFGERLQPALCLARGVRLVAPAIDIGLQLLGFRFLRGARGFSLRLTLAPLPCEGIIIAGIER